MITGMNHTGFVVRDLDRSMAFYRDVVGLQVVASRERQGAPISHLIGYDDVHLKAHLLSAGGDHVLELIQYVHPMGTERHSEERNNLGAAHLAFNVRDIDSTFAQLVSRGARGLNLPAEVAPGRRVCYMQDPDRNWIELIEDTN